MKQLCVISAPPDTYSGYGTEKSRETTDLHEQTAKDLQENPLNVLIIHQEVNHPSIDELLFCCFRRTQIILFQEGHSGPAS